MSLPLTEIPALIAAEDTVIYNTIAASMLLFWDLALTFEEEVELIWRSRQGPFTVLFYIIRYLAVGIRVLDLVVYTDVFGYMQPSTPRCLAWVWFEAVGGEVMLICIETLFLLRVFAFYGRHRFLIAILVPLFLGVIAAETTIIAIAVPKMIVIPNPLPPNLHVGACLNLAVPELYSKLVVPALAFQSLMFALVVIRFIRVRLLGGDNSPHLLVVFVRDGTWAFTLIFSVLLWAALTFKEAQKGEVALNWDYTVVSICGSRLILNLRSEAARKHTGSTLDVSIELNDWRKSVFGKNWTKGGETTRTVEDGS